MQEFHILREKEISTVMKNISVIRASFFNVPMLAQPWCSHHLSSVSQNVIWKYWALWPGVLIANECQQWRDNGLELQEKLPLINSAYCQVCLCPTFKTVIASNSGHSLFIKNRVLNSIQQYLVGENSIHQ